MVQDSSLSQKHPQGHSKQPAKNGEAMDSVGEEDNKYGFGLGKAHRNARPNNQDVDSLVAIPKDHKQDPVQEHQDLIESQLSQPQGLDINKKLVNVDKQQVYLDFKANEGQEYS